MRTADSFRQSRFGSRSIARLRAGVSALLLALLLAGVSAGAASQTPPSPHKSAHARKHAAKAKAESASAQPSEAAPVAPPQPEIPKWPINEKPGQAAVTWDSQGLKIVAQNSSLEQILRDVSTATGAKVDGFSSDQRVFGVYGPGKARDVLAQILLGAGYNVLMIGDQGMGAPRQIVLSSHHKGGEAPAAAGGEPDGNAEAPAEDDDGDVEEQPVPVPQPAARPGFGPGGQPRTPQQIMEEMQQRQQRTQDLQQPQPQ